jgi:signal transduction histidine kinase
MLAVPLVLLVSSFLTFREFNEMRGLYFRNRAATIAARLETLPPDQLSEGVVDLLAAEEPALVDLVVFEAPGQARQAPDSAILDAIWSGRELFRTQEITVNGANLFRAYVPFHSQSRLRVARIDLEATAADFLLVHARHNLLVAVFSGLVLVLLSFYFVWSLRRAARLERRQLELEHLAQLGKLAAVLAHEIRNPLGTIKGFAQLAREKAASAVATLLDPALEEIRRLENLVNHLLLYGRPREPVMRLVEWDQIAGQLEVYARELIGDRSIRFLRGGEPWKLRTDLDLLRQALLNLTRNSIEALTETSGGEVRLVAQRAERGQFVISVEDDGPGIPESVRGKIFQPFVTTKASGTGLGLSISRKLVTSLGGSLELRSVHPRGTKAELVFPHIELEQGALEDQAVWKQYS